MEINVLTYNVKGRSPSSTICDIVKEHNIDILFITEPDNNPSNLLLQLNKIGTTFNYNADNCMHVDVFSKFDSPQFTLIKEFKRTTGWLLQTPLNQVAFIATHYFDKFYNDSKDQYVKIRYLEEEISQIEESIETEKVILTGDLNLDPYDLPCFMSNGLNAIMCRKTVCRVKVKNGKKMFYNPSWNLLGDRFHTPGTYYRSGEGSQYWSVLDQVMMRADAVEHYDVNSLKVVNNTKNESLISVNGIPKEQYSDHLPITFKINI